MQQSGCDPSMAAIGIQHNVFPLEQSLRGDQQDAIPRQPPLVTPARAASPFFLAYIPSLDTCMPIDPQQVGAGPSRAGPLPTNDCIWLHDAWVPFVRAHDAQNPSYAQVVGQETAASSPPTRQQSTPPPPTPKEGIDEFCLLVFGPHKRHTNLRSAKFAVAQVMRLTHPLLYCLCWLAGGTSPRSHPRNQPDPPSASMLTAPTQSTSLLSRSSSSASSYASSTSGGACYSKTKMPSTIRDCRNCSQLQILPISSSASPAADPSN